MNIWVDVNGWPFPPVVLLGCLVAEILYFRGWCLLVASTRAKQTASIRTRTGIATSVRGEQPWNIWFWRGTFFVAALFAFLIASSAAVDKLSSWLLWVHMIQHLLLLVVVAPLLVASAPLLPLWLGLPRWGRQLLKRTVKLPVRRTFYRLGEGLQRQPVMACVLLLLGTWIWHWPPLYDLALSNTAIHDWLEHTTFLTVSIFFWSQVIPAPPLHTRLSYPVRLGCIGFGIAQNIVLAVLIAFAQQPLYQPYAHLVTAPGGLTALQDQQFGAGIMWTFGDLPFGIAFSVLVHHWLLSQSDVEPRAPQALLNKEKVPVGKG